MNASEVVEQLRACGKESYRKTYRRHGAGERLFGVSTADLKSLAKKLRKDDALARELWRSGWYEARILATMIADPKQLDAATLDAWSRDADNYPIAHAVADLAARTPFARAKAEEWMAADDEYVETTGWRLLAHLAAKDAALGDDYFAAKVAAIRARIGGAKNRVRHEMNNTLIAIGLRSEALEKQATDVARAIGKVSVDHGDTECVTPDAIAYMAKARARTRK